MDAYNGRDHCLNPQAVLGILGSSDHVIEMSDGLQKLEVFVTRISPCLRPTRVFRRFLSLFYCLTCRWIITLWESSSWTQQRTSGNGLFSFPHGRLSLFIISDFGRIAFTNAENTKWTSICATEEETRCAILIQSPISKRSDRLWLDEIPKCEGRVYQMEGGQ